LPLAHEQLRPVCCTARCCVVVVELAVGAVRRTVAREDRTGAEERRDEVTREARGNGAGRVLVERSARDRALEVATEAARHARANKVAVLALVRGAIARAVARNGCERPL